MACLKTALAKAQMSSSDIESSNSSIDAYTTEAFRATLSHVVSLGWCSFGKRGGSYQGNNKRQETHFDGTRILMAS